MSLLRPDRRARVGPDRHGRQPDHHHPRARGQVRLLPALRLRRRPGRGDARATTRDRRRRGPAAARPSRSTSARTSSSSCASCPMPTRSTSAPTRATSSRTPRSAASTPSSWTGCPRAQVIAESPLPLALAGTPFSEIQNALPFRNDEAGRALRDRVDAAITTLKAERHAARNLAEVARRRRHGPLSRCCARPRLHAGARARSSSRYVPLTLGMAIAAMALALVLASAARGDPGAEGAGRSTASSRSSSASSAARRSSCSSSCSTTACRRSSAALTAIDGVTAAIMGLTLHFAAYMAESIRAAITGVDRSQWEAAPFGRHDPAADDAADHPAAGRPDRRADAAQLLHRHDQEHLARLHPRRHRDDGRDAEGGGRQLPLLRGVPRRRHPLLDHRRGALLRCSAAWRSRLHRAFAR